jgi:hypothetical protein
MPSFLRAREGTVADHALGTMYLYLDSRTFPATGKVLSLAVLANGRAAIVWSCACLLKLDKRHINEKSTARATRAKAWRLILFYFIFIFDF